jgi:hypothetical protein
VEGSGSVLFQGYPSICLRGLSKTTKKDNPRDIWTRLKVNLSLCLTKHHVIKTYWMSGGIAPCILDLGTRRRWVVSFTPWPLYSRYPLDRRPAGPQSRSGRGGEEKNSQPPPGIETPNPDRPARSLSPKRLSFPGPPEYNTGVRITHRKRLLYINLILIEVKLSWWSLEK